MYSKIYYDFETSDFYKYYVGDVNKNYQYSLCEFHSTLMGLYMINVRSFNWRHHCRICVHWKNSKRNLKEANLRRGQSKNMGGG